MMLELQKSNSVLQPELDGQGLGLVQRSNSFVQTFYRVSCMTMVKWALCIFVGFSSTNYPFVTILTQLGPLLYRYILGNAYNRRGPFFQCLFCAILTENITMLCLLIDWYATFPMKKMSCNKKHMMMCSVRIIIRPSLARIVVCNKKSTLVSFGNIVPIV